MALFHSFQWLNNTLLYICTTSSLSIPQLMDIPEWLSGKESACNAEATGDTGSIPGLGRSSVERNGYPLQYFCLENHMDRGAWRATVHRFAKRQTGLNQLSSSSSSK